MTVIWYCCGCNFGPFNASLYDNCINCGKYACSMCTREKISGGLGKWIDPRPPQETLAGASKPATNSPPETPLQDTLEQAFQNARKHAPMFWQDLSRDLLWSLPQNLPKKQPYVPIYPIYDSTLKFLLKLAKRSTQENHQTQLRRELERLFLWAESLSISALDNNLDATLMKLPELYETIFFTLGELENVIKNSLSEDTTAGSSGEKEFSDTISDISVYIDCLMDLSPAIEIHLLDDAVHLPTAQADDVKA